MFQIIINCCECIKNFFWYNRTKHYSTYSDSSDIYILQDVFLPSYE